MCSLTLGQTKKTPEAFGLSLSQPQEHQYMVAMRWERGWGAGRYGGGDSGSPLTPTAPLQNGEWV